jgi:hypothetical protein
LASASSSATWQLAQRKPSGATNVVLIRTFSRQRAQAIASIATLSSTTCR